MTKWERFEEYLFDMDAVGTSFNSRAIAKDLGIDPKEASDLIQNYLAAQTRVNSKTLFVLTREGRTSRAMWHVGARSVDARHLGEQTVADFQRRLRRFVVPTLQRIEQKNPRAVPAAEAILEGLGAGVKLLVALLNGDGDDPTLVG